MLEQTWLTFTQFLFICLFKFLKFTFKSTMDYRFFLLHRISKYVAYLIFYNLKKLKLIFIIFAINNILIILGSKSVYNLALKPTLIYIIWLFFRAAKWRISHLTAMFVNMPFNKEDLFWLQICICLKPTLHRSYWKNFQASCAGGRHNMPRPLQVYLWLFDLESGVWVTCDVGYLCANLSS